MPRCIDADALIISLAKDRSALANIRVPHCEVYRIDETTWKVVEAPTADVVPVVRGEWTYEISEYFRTCSVCRISQALLAGENLSRFKYCPFCGAKMEVEHDG